MLVQNTDKGLLNTEVVSSTKSVHSLFFLNSLFNCENGLGRKFKISFLEAFERDLFS